jgi:hypothetical protein
MRPIVPPQNPVAVFHGMPSEFHVTLIGINRCGMLLGGKVCY